MSESDDSVEELITAARETAVPIRQFLNKLRPAIVERYGSGDCFTDNIILQSLLLNLCAQTVNMIRSTHKNGLDDKKAGEINYEASKMVGTAIQEIFTKYIGCDALIIGKASRPKKGKSDGHETNGG